MRHTADRVKSTARSGQCQRQSEIDSELCWLSFRKLDGLETEAT